MGAVQDKALLQSSKSHSRPPEPFPYADMSRSLISAASTLAATHVRDDADRLQTIRSRVRYCQLLASRLSLEPARADGTILAAWLSALADRPETIRQLFTVYRVEEIIFPDETGGEPRIEARILELVKSYQEIQAEQPSVGRDVNLTRRHLRRVWSPPSERQDMLETFLHVLMDEQFLARLGGSTGRILIVDPAEATSAILTPPLESNGYEMLVAPDAGAAEASLRKSRPDLIIAEMDLSGMSGLQFCQKMKQNAETSAIPLIMVTALDPEKNASACLRSGADEFLAKPVNLELLFVRIERLLDETVAGRDKAGVTGSLEDMNFTDLIQILCAGGKNVRISLTEGDQEAEVYLQNGDIVHAATGDAEGDSAFYELMRWERGEFVTCHCTDFPQRSVHESAMSLLMEGARLADESAEN
jgi:DNA-binding response OmpR family regulator